MTGSPAVPAPQTRRPFAESLHLGSKEPKVFFFDAMDDIDQNGEVWRLQRPWKMCFQYGSMLILLEIQLYSRIGKKSSNKWVQEPVLRISGLDSRPKSKFVQVQPDLGIILSLQCIKRMKKVRLRGPNSFNKSRLSTCSCILAPSDVNC